MQVVWPANTVAQPCMAVQAQGRRPRRALLFMSMRWAVAASGMSCHGCLMPCCVAAHALLAQGWARKPAGLRHVALSMTLQRVRSAHAAGVRGRMLSSAALRQVAAAAHGGGDPLARLGDRAGGAAPSAMPPLRRLQRARPRRASCAAAVAQGVAGAAARASPWRRAPEASSLAMCWRAPCSCQPSVCCMRDCSTFLLVGSMPSQEQCRLACSTL